MLKDREQRLAYYRSYYKANPLRYKGYTKKYKERTRCSKTKYDMLVRQQRQLRLAEMKSRPCMDCNQSFPDYVMEFDHVRGEKKFNIAAYTGRSWVNIEAEIAKCDLVCSNCHQIRTWNQIQIKKTKRQLIAAMHY